MCEGKIDWTKPVEIKINGLWQPFGLLWRDIRWPRFIVGRIDNGTPLWCNADFETFRNAPPPPPEVWIVWSKSAKGPWKWHGTYTARQDNMPESYHQQKVPCDAPDIR